MFVYDIISANGIVNIIIETHYAINYQNLQDSCSMVSFQMILHMGYIDVHLHIRLWRNSHQSEPFCGKWARDTKSALHCFCLSVCLVFFHCPDNEYYFIFLVHSLRAGGSPLPTPGWDSNMLRSLCRLYLDCWCCLCREKSLLLRARSHCDYYVYFATVLVRI